MIPDNNVLKIYADGVAATGMSTKCRYKKAVGLRYSNGTNDVQLYY